MAKIRSITVEPDEVNIKEALLKAYMYNGFTKPQQVLSDYLQGFTMSPKDRDFTLAIYHKMVENDVFRSFERECLELAKSINIEKDADNS